MQQVWLALIIGLIIGWLIEWLIDWRYWRKNVALLRAENADLQRRIAAYAAAQAPVHLPATDDQFAAAPASDVSTAAAPIQQVE
jgi:hypothetical protein